MGRCPTMLSDLAATIGVHVDTKHPDKQEEVFGSLHRKTTDLTPALGLALPLGNSTSPGHPKEGTACIAHRHKRAVPGRPGQKPRGDSASDSIANSEWRQARGASAVFAYTRRPAHVEEPSLWQRGYAQNGTP